MNKERREFLAFLGRTSAGISAASILGDYAFLDALAGKKEKSFQLDPIKPSDADTVILAEGFEYTVVMSWNDPIAANLRYGFNCDYLATFPLSKDEILLWSNHEYPSEVFVSQYNKKSDGKKKLEQVVKEQESVGGSIVRLKKSKGVWGLVKNDPLNRRLDGKTKIPFAGGVKVMGKSEAIGTMGNCAGGVTPWGTVLTCEENYQDYYRDVDYSSGSRIVTPPSKYTYAWEEHFDNPPEHYGWVVEVNPKTGAAKKLTGLGRFAHEGATCVRAKDGRVVVYMGDDLKGQCLYKFISKTKNSLEQGTLYVANLEKGKWVPMDPVLSPSLKPKFKDSLDVAIRAREAAAILGGTAINRPEDIEIDPKTKNVLVAVTGDPDIGDPFGSILKIKEKNSDFLSLDFKSEIFVTGGPATGFANPDNLLFDRKGNLWMTSDISGSKIGKDPYKGFKNNGLFYIPMSGINAGKVFQIASAPRDAEFTGPCLSPDGKTLFVSVQHPGENTTEISSPTSHWPLGAPHLPKPSVIAVSGPGLASLLD